MVSFDYQDTETRVIFNSWEEQKVFLDFLKKMAIGDPVIANIVIPIIEQECIIPVGLDFVQLCQNNGITHIEVPSIISKYWRIMTNGVEAKGLAEDETWLSAKEAAEYLRRSIKTVWIFAKEGILKAEKQNGRWRFSKSSLNAFLATVGYPTIAP